MSALRSLLFISITLISFVPFAQRTEKYASEYANFYRGEELFEKEQFSAAKEEFRQFLNEFDRTEDPQYIKARYYEGLSALQLYNNDAIKLLQEFINDYPESIYINDINFKIGQYFYQRKKYLDALQWLEETDQSQLNDEVTAEYYFKLGYANFQLGNYSQARNAFYEIKDDSSNYSSPALYYYSHIAYQNETYQEALDGFLKLADDPSFAKEVPYYITQIYYLLGDFERVTAYSPDLKDQSLEENTPEMNLLIGDAYYRIKKFDEAAEYLENHYARANTTPGQKYALGYAYYKSQQYEKAIRILDIVSRQEDALAQTAYYHIAQCYMETGELNYARAAFESAAQLDFESQIEEDALYNYAVLSYRMDYNPYNAAILAFERFLNEFPNSKRKEDVYSYLVNVYSSTSRHQEALNSLNRIGELNIQLKTAYQIISYNMGVGKYEKGDYQAAVDAFDKVDKYDIDPSVTGKSKYWVADAHYMLGNYLEAIKEYKAFIATPGTGDIGLKQSAYYNIAYAYYETEDWTQAIQAFRTYTQLANLSNRDKEADAYARIGDCYYTSETPDFQKAALNYEKSLTFKKGNQDRVLYVLAKVYGFMPDKREQRITTLLDIINNYTNSAYLIPSIYDVGMSYKNQRNYDKALTFFNQIINDFPNNILVKDAIIEIADIKYREKKYQASESYFRRALNEFALDDETCKRATQGLIDIFKATKRQSEITQLRTEYACAGISEDDEEIIFYEAANDLYLSENFDEAIPEIQKYLERYPDGRFTIQLLSYIGDIYYQKDELNQALVYYENIIARTRSAFTEEALVRASKILYNDGRYERALPYYDQLEDLASSPQVIFNTRVGLMRCNFILENYENAAEAAKNVLKDDLLNDETINVEGNYIAGMSLFNTQAYQEAIHYLEWTEKNTGQVRGTEALYTLANVYYKLGEYDKSEKIHQDLLKRKPAYDYWIAKSLILQSRVFMAKDDLFQADKTIELVIANYPIKDDGIINEAEQVQLELLQLQNTEKTFENNTGRTIDLNGGNDE
jgi:tetratricopeptide (TPR) repeat protein